jgi:hypothetical protein
MSYIPRPGDEVFHKPSRQTWVVRYVRRNRLSPCGWPLCEAQLSDCRVTYVLTDVERVAFYNEYPTLKVA